MGRPKIRKGIPRFRRCAPIESPYGPAPIIAVFSISFILKLDFVLNDFLSFVLQVQPLTQYDVRELKIADQVTLPHTPGFTHQTIDPLNAHLLQ
jgi:hypothetical protein